MSVSLLPSSSTSPLCPLCCRLDSLVPLDSPFPTSISPLSLTPFLPSHPSPDLAPTNPNADSDAPCPLPAPKDSIVAIPTVNIDDLAAVCAICKDDLPHGSSARLLPCSHLYHSDCIVPWLSLRNSCPLCRSAIPCHRRTRTPPFRFSVLGPEDVIGIDMEASFREIMGAPWATAGAVVSSSQMGMVETGSVGLANSGETVTSGWQIGGGWGGVEEAELSDAMISDYWEDVFS